MVQQPACARLETQAISEKSVFFVTWHCRNLRLLGKTFTDYFCCHHVKGRCEQLATCELPAPSGVGWGKGEMNSGHCVPAKCCETSCIYL
jgi:hypothetical protein